MRVHVWSADGTRDRGVTASQERVKMTPVKVTRGVGRNILLAALLGAAACGLFSACSSMPVGPTYTDDELRAICERQGGWWRGNLVQGYCEFQAP